MGTSSSRLRPRGWKAWACAVAIVGIGLSGVSAQAAEASAPGAPTISSVNAVGLNRVEVAFAAPVDDGGARVLSYQAMCTSTDGGLTRTHDARHSPIRVPSLTGGKTYRCTVTATNRAGTGPASRPSAVAVVRPSAPPAPTITSVNTVDELRSITVTFVTPAGDGGAPIRNYRATCTSTTGGATHAREAHQSPITVTDLTAADSYRCTVAADNRVGLSPSSAGSSLVTRAPDGAGGADDHVSKPDRVPQGHGRVQRTRRQWRRPDQELLGGVHLQQRWDQTRPSRNPLSDPGRGPDILQDVHVHRRRQQRRPTRPSLPAVASRRCPHALDDNRFFVDAPSVRTTKTRPSFGAAQSCPFARGATMSLLPLSAVPWTADPCRR